MSFCVCKQNADYKTLIKSVAKTLSDTLKALIVSNFYHRNPEPPTWTVAVGAVVAAVNNPATAVMEEEEEEVVGVTNTHLDPAIGPAQNAKPTISPPEQRATGAIPILTRAAGEAV